MLLAHCTIHAVKYPHRRQFKRQDRIGVQSIYEGGETNLSETLLFITTLVATTVAGVIIHGKNRGIVVMVVEIA